VYLGLRVKYRLFSSDFNRTRISLTDLFEKYSNIKFSENPFSGNRVFPCGGTDRRDEANRRFSQFCERA